MLGAYIIVISSSQIGHLIIIKCPYLSLITVFFFHLFLLVGG